MLFNSYSYEILCEQFHLIYLQEDVQLLLVTVNNRLKFEIEIVHNLSCHPIIYIQTRRTAPPAVYKCVNAERQSERCGIEAVLCYCCCDAGCLVNDPNSLH